MPPCAGEEQGCRANAGHVLSGHRFVPQTACATQCLVLVSGNRQAGHQLQRHTGPLKVTWWCSVGRRLGSEFQGASVCAATWSCHRHHPVPLEHLIISKAAPVPPAATTPLPVSNNFFFRIFLSSKWSWMLFVPGVCHSVYVCRCQNLVLFCD